MPKGERRLAAIMFTDVVGFTAMAQLHESRALEELETMKELVRSVFSSMNGTEVKTIGDAFLIEFPSALDAVNCAVEIQRRIRDRNRSLPEGRKMPLRIGVHLGDVIHVAGDVMGDAVNVSSRIEPLAEPDGVCISEQVYDHVRNKLDLPLLKLQGKTLKNVRIPIDVYKLVMPWEEDEPRGELDPKRVAVLPFANMSPDPNDQYFTDGMTEELISALSRIKGLAVISRTSVMQYKNQSKHLTDIARELNVGTLIEGSVRKAGNRVRIAVQLIDANNDKHLWAENYERNLDDVFAIQSDVSSRVAGSLEAGAFAPPNLIRDTANMESYTLYLRATQLSHQYDESSLKEAIASYDRAISLDAGFVRAYLGAALAWASMALAGHADMSVIKDRAEIMAMKATQLSPESAEAHATLAIILSYQDKFTESRTEAQKAVEINPNVSQAQYCLGMDSGTTGDLQSALVYFRKALALDPLSFHTAEVISLILRTAGEVDQALEVLEKLRKLYPKNPKLFVGFAECYMLRRDFATAQSKIDEGLAISPDDPLLRLDQGVLYALTGRREEAMSVLKYSQEDKSASVRSYSQLFIQSALGNREQAIEALMRGIQTHVWPFLIKTLPIFEDLRKDPRFGEFCARIGI